MSSPTDDGTPMVHPSDQLRTAQALGYNTGSWVPSNTSTSDLAIPQRIGRFLVQALLGAGAFGRVFLAFDPEMCRKVAIKLPIGEGLNRECCNDFLKEARAAAAIDQHPNVCQIFHVDTDDGLPYIVMRYVAGGTLKSLMERRAGLFSVRTAIAIARKLALGLERAHKKGVIHRDLKPANVLYDDENREVLITDFGLARITVSESATASLNRGAHGTPRYMPPEQWGSKSFGEISPLADVYSLGILLYEMLTGQAPFNGGMLELMTKHCEELPRPLSDIRPGLDPKLDALCLKALAKTPADRYASAKAFADALSMFLSYSGGVAPEERPPSVRPDAALGERPVAEQHGRERCATVPDVVVPTIPPRQIGIVLPMIDSPHRAAEEQNATASRLKVDLAWTNTVGIHFRLIPAGEFRAGPTLDDPAAKPSVRPIRVKVEWPFWVASFPVTNRIIDAFLDDPGEEKGLASDRLFALAARAGGAEDLPATHISAIDAAAVCRWLSRIDANRCYRLPTEAEWEFFARSGREAAAHPRVSLAPTTGPSPADSRRANPFGLIDVVGNVSEWTATPFAFQLDAVALTRSESGGGSGALTVRGGSWRCKLDDLTLAWRKSVAANRRADDLGIRLVCELTIHRGARDE